MDVALRKPKRRLSKGKDGDSHNKHPTRPTNQQFLSSIGCLLVAAPTFPISTLSHPAKMTSTPVQDAPLARSSQYPSLPPLSFQTSSPPWPEATLTIHLGRCSSPLSSTARRRRRWAASRRAFHASASSKRPDSARRWSGRRRESVGGSLPRSRSVISLSPAAKVVRPYVVAALSTRRPARQISEPDDLPASTWRRLAEQVPARDVPVWTPSGPNVSTCTSSPRPPNIPRDRNSTAARAPVESLATAMVPTGSTYFSPMTTLRRNMVAVVHEKRSSEPSARRRTTRARPSVLSSMLLPQNFWLGAGAQPEVLGQEHGAEHRGPGARGPPPRRRLRGALLVDHGHHVPPQRGHGREVRRARRRHGRSQRLDRRPRRRRVPVPRYVRRPRRGMCPCGRRRARTSRPA